MTALLMTTLWWAYTASIVYLLAVAAIFLLMVLVAAVEGRIRARQSRHEDFDTLRESPFTIPVSIIAPAYNEAVCITQAVSSLLALSYSQPAMADDGDRLTLRLVALQHGAYLIEIGH